MKNCIENMILVLFNPEEEHEKDKHATLVWESMQIDHKKVIENNTKMKRGDFYFKITL